MRKVLLAIDVGGSTTRASVVDETGRCLGYGRNRGGNPASNSPGEAAAAMISAVEQAVAEAGQDLEIGVALIALAGPQVRVERARLETAFGAAGLVGPIVFAGDLQAMFASVTLATEGYCVVCGTGAGVIRIRAGEIDRVVDLAGWLLGDLGSGYWLGHEAAKAAVAEMEGRGEATSLTPVLLKDLGIDDAEGGIQGRPMALRKFIDAVYALRPIELARFAPVVVAHRGDPVADRLLAEAERYLVSDFATAFDPAVPGPVVLGGGVVAHLSGLRDGISKVISAAGLVPEVHLGSDGSVGASVLALRAVGIAVDDKMFRTITTSVAERNARAKAAP